MVQERLVDLLVIGGGIHGVAVAADAAGRGLSVLLCEQNDLASGTSNASTKLIHGGLRYLAQYDFRLVKEALKERSILTRIASHLVEPQRFILPHHVSSKPFWLMRLGLFYYDWMGHDPHYAHSRSLNIDPTDPLNPLQAKFKKGLIYSDATTDDARLVITTALRAAQKGAQILTRTQCIEAKRQKTHWQIKLQNTQTKNIETLQAKAIVNATGPWISPVLDTVLEVPSTQVVRLVKGSHIVIPRLYPQDQAYLLTHTDGRVIFVIPYLSQFSLVGTTDIHAHTVSDGQISFEEIEYLCNIVNDYFLRSIKPEHVHYSWSGVRTLLEEEKNNPAKISREYKIELNTTEQNTLPLVNIYGGKLTTHRCMAEKIVNLLKPFFPSMGSAWTALSPLPGSDFAQGNKKGFLHHLHHEYPHLPKSLLVRYMRQYGTHTTSLLGKAQSLADLGEHFGHDLYEKEIAYLIEHEWAATGEDILWRRTKLGLFLTPQEQAAVNEAVNKIVLKQKLVS